MLSPLVVVYLSLTPVSAAVTGASAAMAGIGAFVVAWRALGLAQSGPAPD